MEGKTRNGKQEGKRKGRLGVKEERRKVRMEERRKGSPGVKEC